MEKRVLLAIVLMTATVVVFNLLFPPAPPRRGAPPSADTAAATGTTTADTPATPAAEEGTVRREEEGAGGRPPGFEPGRPAGEQQAGPAFGREPEERGDTVVVSGPLYRYAFSTRGAALVGATLRKYTSYAPNGAGREEVQLIRRGDRLLSWKVAAGGDTLDLSDRSFAPGPAELELTEGGEPATLTFRDSLPEYPGLAFVVTYRFRPDRYLVEVEGGLEGIGEQGYTVLTSLGRGLRTNEKDPDEDYDQLAYVARTRGGEIQKEKLDDVDEGATVHPEGGPFGWVAVKNKYFVTGLVAPEGRSGFGGLTVVGLSDDHAAEMDAALPVPAGQPGFRIRAYVGPQERDRLTQVGQEFQSVNPIGYDWLRFIIRPLADIVTAILTWLHTTLGLAYGWVLILFGVMMRVVLFPLYQKSMRAQMAQMEVQPVIKELQDKYEDDPQKLQQEMMRVYRENNLNPLAGCLPMLLPFPILITLFFVFQSTIEFRGVPFLYLADLSQEDPYYIIPVVMGLSMFLLQWIGQRGMERNTQMKLMSYGMPIVFTLLFLRFPAGLNLYYATSNLASLPQQFYLSRERQKIQSKRGD